METNFRQLTMSDVVTEFRGGDSFTKMEYKSSGIPVLTKGDVKTHGRVSFNGERFIDPANQAEKGYKLTKKGDFILTTRDLTTAANFLGLLSPVPDPYFFLVNQGANVLRFSSEVDPRYLIYWTHSSEYRWHIKNHAVGSTQIHLRKGDFLSAPLQLPSIRIQKEIAHILGTLDDKIELNRKTNETLEGIAKALFKSWFVDFDPVRAKAEGRQTGLPDEVSKLFPDSFQESELGEIPSGWTVEELGSLANISGGKQLGEGKLKEKGSVPVYGANGVMGFNEEKNHFGFVIIFGRVGAYCGSVRWEYDGAWVNNNASSVVPGSNPEFVLRSMLEADYTNLRSGSAQPFISNSALSGSRILSPPTSLKDLYCQLSQPLLLKQKALSSQSETFALLRDALLPKLISGELRVPDAEKMIEEIGI